MKKKHSLKITIFLPLLLLICVAAVVVGYLDYRYLSSNIQRDAKQRSEIIAYSVQYTAEIAGSSPELNRIVQALATEQDIVSINVVLQESGFILASSRISQRSKSIDDLPRFDWHQDLVDQVDRYKEIDNYGLKPNSSLFVYASPFLMSVNGELTRAIVFVDLDTRAGTASISNQMTYLAILLLVIAIFISTTVFLLLNTYIFSPIQYILSAIENRRRGKAPVSATALRLDEIGVLASSFNDLMAKEDEAKSQLSQREQELQLIFDTVPVLIWYKDDKNNILRVNRSAAHSIGMNVEQVEGKNTAELFPEMAEKYLEDDLDVINSGTARLNIVERYTPIDQDPGWVITDKIPYEFKELGRRGVLAVSQDISNLKKAELQLLESEQRFTLVAEATRDGIWDWPNIETDDEYWSPQWKRLLGYEDHEIEASAARFFDMLHPDDRELTVKAVESHKQGDAPFDVEYRLRAKNGKYKWFLARGIITTNEATGTQRMTGSITDIQERKESEKRLIHYTNELERSNRDLDEFAYVASHDLKAPLRGLDQLATWIGEDVAEKKYDELGENLDLMRSRVARMSALLSDLLKYSRVGRRKEELSIADTASLVRQAFDLSAPPEPFSLVVGSLPVFETYSAPLEQVFRNLIGNAIKHRIHDEGTVTVSMTGELGEYYIFEVSDDGSGIEKKYHELIFKMFKSLKPRDEVEGSGMGLALIKKIVDFYRGEIEVISSPNQGSTFKFSWPKEIRKSLD